MATTFRRLHQRPHALLRPEGLKARKGSSNGPSGLATLFETLALGSYAALLYKAYAPGMVFLALLAASYFFRKKDNWRPAIVTSVFAIAYIAMATMTAFLVEVQDGLERTVQGVVVVAAAASIVGHVSGLTSERRRIFLKRFTFLNVCILLHCVLFHVLSGRMTTWKYLADTKFVFSAITLLLFVWEDELRRRSIMIWSAALAGVLIIVLLSGERKAYLLFVALYLLSRARWSTIAGAAATAVALGSAFVAVSPNSYVAHQLQSGAPSHDIKSLPNRYFFTVPAIADHSDLIRTFVNRNADRLFQQHRWFGVGATGYGAWSRATYGSLAASGGLSMNVHGERHRVPAEGGIAGIVVALGLIGLVALRAARFWIAEGGLQRRHSPEAPHTP